MEDGELIRDFLQQGSQEAFAELVSRHVNFVYSSARRQVRSAQLAEEVTQSVFLDLARHAAKLDTRPPLTAWLYVVTRRTALDAVRAEQRRQAREQAAYELSAMNSLPSSWSQVEPLLDEALETLNRQDRSAVLLRYFENKPLREVGAALGTSEEAARKRVSRAVEDLRRFFAKRGVAVSAAGLVTDLSAQAVQTAPAALGTAISAAAGAATAGSVAAVAAAQTLAMTALQKTTLVSALVLILGAGLYEARALQLQAGDLLSAEDQKTQLLGQIHREQQGRAEAARQLGSNREKIAALQAGAAAAKGGIDAGTEADMRAWYARVDQLHAAFERSPQLKIPELALLGEMEWFAEAQDALDTPEQVRHTMGSLRDDAKMRLSSQMGAALQAYQAAHRNALPATPAQLLSYFNPPIDPAILDRYEMLQTDQPPAAGVTGPAAVVSEKEIVDPEFDHYFQISIDSLTFSDPLDHDVELARKAFRGANAGQSATDPSQLLPYLKTPVDPSTLLRFFKSGAGQP